MGVLSSSPVKTDTNEVLNYLLKNITSVIDVDDLVNISNPSKCGKYILFGAKAIDDLFQKVHLYAGTSSDDYIYFQKTTKMVNGMSDKQKREHRKNCMEISKYYTEIFRIFSLVLLTTYNSTLPIDITNEHSGGGGLVQKINEQEFNYEIGLGKLIHKTFETQQGMILLKGLYIGQIKLISADKVNRDIVSVTLVYTMDNTKVTAKMELEDSVLKLSNFTLANYNIPDGYNIRLNVSESNGTFTCRADTGVEEKMYRCLTFGFVKLTYDISPQPTIQHFIALGYVPQDIQSGFTKLRGNHNLYLDGLSINSKTVIIINDRYRCEVSIDKTDELNYSVEVSDIRLKSDRTTNESSVIRTIQGINIPDFINDAINSISQSSDRIPSNISKAITPVSEMDISKLKTSLLKKYKHPVCNAYAKQLLDALNSDSSDYICNRSFRIDSGIPAPNQKVSESKLLAPFWKLFVDTLESEGKRISGDPTWMQFKMYLQRMDYLKEITKVPQCGRSMKTADNSRENVHIIVQDLINRQSKHDQAAIEILWKLFDKNSALQRRGLELNEELIQGGKKYLSEVRSDCVELFTSYFTECERLSYEGIKLLLGNN
jgi:hypothetical protein